MIATRPTTPATTPPAIAPTLACDFDEEPEGFVVWVCAAVFGEVGPAFVSGVAMDRVC